MWWLTRRAGGRLLFLRRTLPSTRKRCAHPSVGFGATSPSGEAGRGCGVSPCRQTLPLRGRCRHPPQRGGQLSPTKNQKAGVAGRRLRPAEGVDAYRARRNVHCRRQRRRCGRSRTEYAPFHASLLPRICTISTPRPCRQ